jgi:hypothetical protein
MVFRALLGIVLTIAGIIGMIVSVITFTNNLFSIMFWPFLGAHAALSADQIGNYAKWALASLFLGTPISYLVAKIGWSILSNDS